MGQALSRFAPGDQAVLRSVWHGKITHVRPVTVVQDDDDLTALYLAPGTICKACNLPGDHPGLQENLIKGTWSLLEHPWERTRVLMLRRPEMWYSIYAMWPADGGDLLAWYVNLEEPQRRCRVGWDWRDMELDIVVAPDMTWTWKDEAEFASLLARNLITPDEARRVRAEGEHVVALIESSNAWWLGWKSWAPDPSWPIPTLPAGWDEV